MTILFISRKKRSDVGGLSRFAIELTSAFPNALVLSPDSLATFWKLPFVRFDVIHLCDATLLPLGVLLKFLFRKPLTLTAHGKDLTFPSDFYQAMLTLLLPKVDAIVFVSMSVRPLLRPHNLSKQRIFVIPNGVSLTRFANPQRVSFSIQTTGTSVPSLARRDRARLDRIVLLTVGNLVARKGHAWFIREVFAKLTESHPERSADRRGVEGSHEFVYLIVGDGPQRQAIEETVKHLELDSRVFLLGSIRDAQLAFVLGKTDIYVCPNQHIEGDFEGFGIAAGEAAAMGLPVVASNVDGITEVIKDGKSGLLVEPTPQAFREAIVRLREEEVRERVGQSQRRI